MALYPTLWKPDELREAVFSEDVILPLLPAYDIPEALDPLSQQYTGEKGTLVVAYHYICWATGVDAMLHPTFRL